MDKNKYERIIEIHKQLENLKSISHVICSISPSNLSIRDVVNHSEADFYNTDTEFRRNIKAAIFALVDAEIKRLEKEISDM